MRKTLRYFPLVQKLTSQVLRIADNGLNTWSVYVVLSTYNDLCYVGCCNGNARHLDTRLSHNSQGSCIPSVHERKPDLASRRLRRLRDGHGPGIVAHNGSETGDAREIPISPGRDTKGKKT